MNIIFYLNCLNQLIKVYSTQVVIFRQLLWSDVTLHNDRDLATEYLEHNERQTKTRTGIDLNNIRREKPRVYATYTETCPVAIYKAYSDHRPDQFSGISTNKKVYVTVF